MAYAITRKYIAGLPQQPYRKGVGVYEMIVAHATADYEATDENELSYFINNWRTRQAFPHTFADWDSITELADPKYKAWGAGNANSRAVHVELCQTKNAAKFKESYARWIWVMAYYLYQRKLEVKDGVTLVSHDWVSKNLGGTDHSDPIGYLVTWNITWAQVVKDVAAAYAAMPPPKVTSVDPVIEAIKKLQAAGVIHSPEYWLENAKTGKTVVGEYAGQLIVNLASNIPVDPVIEAIIKLQAAGVIHSPEYWLENAKTGKTVNGGYAGQLLINLAATIK
ncbi:MAG: N-acetylmuramoyl-L-alanine amidase [Thermincola sp.]|jgi:hypothetical protein|nr:N-acetylmuramoyl-L-alanine amidase [Thermincola sp.]MDT3703192.1 N-acetylmuramoyl-L-alanine amidase [Thermincola sp.]